MEQIDVDGNISSEAIKETLAAMFPALRAFEWNIFIGEEKPEGEEEPNGYDSNNPSHVFYAVHFISGRTEFKRRITFFMRVGDGTSEREMAIAHELSAKFSIRTMAGFTPPDNPNYPYYFIVFINGSSYLADDCDFDFNGEGIPKN